MKNPFTRKSKAPKTERTDEASVDKVLLSYQVDGTSLAAYIHELDITGDTLELTLKLPKDADKSPETIHAELGQSLSEFGVRKLNLNIIQSAPAGQSLSNPKPKPKPKPKEASKLPKTTNAAQAQKPQAHAPHGTSPNQPPRQNQIPPHPRIKHIIVVASGKGGVGKSTTTVNLALALKKLGNRVGVLDADIYGPSIPTMLSVAGKQPEVENEQFVPLEAHGLAMLSIGNLLGSDNTPVAWRGPKATGALMQLYNQTNWPNLDFLVIDLPPGTGDIQLTLAQRIPVTGAVIVTTPQHIALMDAQKGIELFAKVDIPVLGVVENMALHTCSNCGHTDAIFGTGGGKKMSEQYQVPLLGQLPLAAGIREQADRGAPSVVADDAYSDYYVAIAQKVVDNVSKIAANRHAQEAGAKRIF